MAVLITLYQSHTNHCSVWKLSGSTSAWCAEGARFNPRCLQVKAFCLKRWRVTASQHRKCCLVVSLGISQLPMSPSCLGRHSRDPFTIPALSGSPQTLDESKMAPCSCFDFLGFGSDQSSALIPQVFALGFSSIHLCCPHLSLPDQYLFAGPISWTNILGQLQNPSNVEGTCQNTRAQTQELPYHWTDH